MNTGQEGSKPFALGLDEVPHLVQEDQHNDAKGEFPAPDQRVAAEGHEDRRELRKRPELREQADQEDEWRRDLADEAAPVHASRMDRLVVALRERLH